MHKIALEFGGFTITWFGVLVASGVLAGLWNASRRGMNAGYPPESILDLGFWLLLSGVIGARIWYVMTYWQESFAGKPWTEVFMIQKGGIVFYGGFIGAFLAGLIYVRWHRLPVWKTADVLAPSLALGYAIGRWGCLMNGCCFGRSCEWPWAIRFPREHETEGLPVHPTQIYESLLNIGLFFFLSWWFKRKKFDGQIFCGYLVGYALLRSFVELFRGDYPAPKLQGYLTPAHWISLLLIASGVVLWCILSPKRSRV